MDRQYLLHSTQLTISDKLNLYLHEISSKSVTDYSNNSHSHHLPRAKKHIEMAVNELTRTDGGENNSSYLAKLQFILCQLDNTFTPKNRRRYNIVKQIMSIKTHLISPACYAYLQGLECLSQPHVQTLRNCTLHLVLKMISKQLLALVQKRKTS